MKKILLIANPAAGRCGAKNIQAALQYLEQAGHTVEPFLTRVAGEATAVAAQAREGSYDLVVAAGGDGTLNEVISGLSPSDVPLACLPCGTTNVFALEAGIPFDISQACAVALHGTPRPICLGRAGKATFLTMAGVGFDARAVAGVNLQLKQYSGKLAYVWSGLLTWLGWQPKPLEIVSENGTTHRGYGAVISNGRYYGGRFSITPDASLLENRLDVCLFKQGGRMNLLAYAWRIALGLPLEPPAVIRFVTRHLSIQGDRLPVQVDGDYLGTLPMDFSTMFGKITMMCPQVTDGKVN